MSTKCCICLDTANSESIKLLGCGCQSAWFHASCENAWLSSSEYPYSCPTCRRNVPFTTNYSFSYYAGPDQKTLWFVMICLIIETIISSSTQTFTISLQSYALMTTPFVIYSNQYMPYYIFQTLVRMYFNIFIIISQRHSYETIKMVGYLYIFTIYSIHFIQYRLQVHVSVEPLLPYAISREIIHVKELIAEPSADTLERLPRGLASASASASASATATAPAAALCSLRFGPKLFSSLSSSYLFLSLNLRDTGAPVSLFRFLRLFHVFRRLRMFSFMGGPGLGLDVFVRVRP